MQLETYLTEKLTEALEATHINLVDSTWEHKGHSGSNGGAHISVTIVSEKFKGLPMLDQHRLVHTALKSEMQSNLIHALNLKTLTPEQFQPTA